MGMFIGVRVPDELKLKVEDLCESEGKSISELVRELLQEYVELKEEEWRKVKLCVKIPEKLYRQAKLFVDYGYYSDMQDVINDALRLWLRVEKREYDKDWEKRIIDALEAREL